MPLFSSLRPVTPLLCLTTLCLPVFTASASAQTTSCKLAPQSPDLSVPFDHVGAPAADLEPFKLSALTLGTPASTPGRSGQALSFDGIDDYLEISAPIIPSLRDFTISTWVRVSSSPGINVIADNRNPTTGAGIQLALYDGQPLLQIADDRSWANHWLPGVRIDDGQWHHLAVSLRRGRAGGVRFYVDGNFVGALDPRSDLGALAGTNLWIGRGRAVPGSSGSQLFRGDLDELLIHRGELGDAEINRMAASGGEMCNTFAENLAAARALWAQSRPRLPYLFTSAWSHRGAEDLLYEVNGTTVVSTNLETRERSTPWQTGDIMAEYFDRVERGIARRVPRLEVTYHPTYGFPADVYIDWSLSMADEESIFELKDFKVRTVPIRSCWRACSEFFSYAQSFCADYGAGTTVDSGSSCRSPGPLSFFGRATGACLLPRGVAVGSFGGTISSRFCSER